MTEKDKVVSNERKILEGLMAELRRRIAAYPDTNEYHYAVRDTCIELLREIERKLCIRLPKNRGYCYFCGDCCITKSRVMGNCTTI